MARRKARAIPIQTRETHALHKARKAEGDGVKEVARVALLRGTRRARRKYRQSLIPYLWREA